MYTLLKSLAFGLCAGGVAARAVEVEKREDNVTLAAPIVVSPSLHWEGVDGSWSTFEIRVGTVEKGQPGGTYRILPATSWQETWVIYQAAANVCDTSLGVPEDCWELRGGQFDSAKSSTWNETYDNPKDNQHPLGLNANLGEDGQGQYGFDTVGLGLTPNDGPTLTKQIVSEIFSNTFWFGILGLGFQPTNFTGYNDPQPSFAHNLYSNGSISSMSWSYTAGAYYRLKSVYGSLIFGGYDASRFAPNDLTFTMTGDTFRDLVVTIRSITSTTLSGNTTLMSTPEFAFIDSTVPELWLPKEVCQEFEKAFGLTLDEDAGVYLVDNSTHDKLLASNPNITITLGNQKEGGDTIDIVLPYAAFDLTLKPPLLANRTSLYFPLMQQTDPDAYTLGRTFLQEAYVTTHYNSRTFNVSQTLFDESAPAHVVAIPSVLPTFSSSSGGNGNGNGTSTGHKKKLSSGAIAGIAIGALAVVIAIGSIIACFLMGLLCFRSRKQSSSRPSTPIAEIDPGRRVEPKPLGAMAYESQASAFTSEVDGTDAKVEIQGNPIMHPQELEAEVPIMPGTVESERVNGPSDSSRETGVSSLSPIREQKTPMAELGVEERGLGAGAGAGRSRRGHEEHVVSPNSPTIPQGSMMGRARGAASEDGSGRESPTISEATWTPSSPVQRRGTSGSRFEERWDHES